jgi:hypothetical protein
LEKSDECVLWEGALNSGGYPVTWENGKTVYKHRQVAGAVKGQVVLHSCDNPSCINPAHLSIGTSAQNSKDMVMKNRQAKGEQCFLARLTESQVKDILSVKGDMSSREAAALFGCSKTNILDIWNRKIWRHIESIS